MNESSPNPPSLAEAIAQLTELAETGELPNVYADNIRTLLAHVQPAGVPTPDEGAERLAAAMAALDQPDADSMLHFAAGWFASFDAAEFERMLATWKAIR